MDAGIVLNNQFANMYFFKWELGLCFMQFLSENKNFY